MAAMAEKSIWRWFPVALFAIMAVVFAVNAFLVVLAVRTHPGSAGEGGFDLSNHYDIVLADAARQSGLGWRVAVTADAGRHPRIAIADRLGASFDGAEISARATRPVGPPESTVLSLVPVPGGLIAREALAAGQWLVFVTVVRDGQALSATERLVLK